MNTIWPYLGQIWQCPRVLYALVTGGLLGVGFIVPTLWWCGVVGILGVLHVTTLPLRTRTIVGIVWVAWFVKYLCALAWYTSIFPLTWISGLTPLAQIVTIGVYLLTSALWLSSGGFVCSYLILRAYRARAMPRFVWYLSLPFLWLVGELCGAFFFSLLTAGPGSFLQTYFSFGMVGYLLAETEIGTLLSSGYGVWGLSLGIVTLSTLLFWSRVLSRRTQLVFVSILGTLFFSVTYLVGVQTDMSPKGITVISVDTTFDENSVLTPEGEQKRLQSLDAAITAAVAARPTYILLPEDSRFIATAYGDVSPQSALGRFLFTHGNTSSILIDSSRVEMPNGEVYLRAHIFDGPRQAVYSFDKQYLVPQGEYVPYLYAGVLRLLGFGTMIDRLARDSAYQPGSYVRGNEVVPSDIPGVLFCFESVRPDGVTSLQRSGAVPFVVHPLSHGWFHQPKQLWHQLDIMLRVQSRYSGVPIVSAGNLVSGTLYLPNGQTETGEVIETGNGWLLRQFVF